MAQQTGNVTMTDRKIIKVTDNGDTVNVEFNPDNHEFWNISIEGYTPMQFPTSIRSGYSAQFPKQGKVWTLVASMPCGMCVDFLTVTI